MKILAFVLITILSAQGFAQGPRAYISTSKKNLIVDGKESKINGFSLTFKVPGEFSENPEAHDLYKKYINLAKWSRALTFAGMAGIIAGSIDGEDAVWISGAVVYVAGVLMFNNSAMKLQKAINIYNGVPPNLAFEKDIRNPRQSSAPILAWKFDF